MKKKKIDLGRKLFLGKTIISELNSAQQDGVLGGATVEVSVCIACHSNTPSCGAVCQTQALCATEVLPCYTITRAGGICC